MQARHGQKGKLLEATSLDLLVRTSSIALNLLSRFVVLEVRRACSISSPAVLNRRRKLRGGGSRMYSRRARVILESRDSLTGQGRP